MRINDWEGLVPVRILFGAGQLDQLPALVDDGVLVVTTPGATRRGLTATVASLLHAPLVHDEVESNPTIDSIQNAIDRWRPAGIRGLVAVGGGSAIDVAKVLSLALATEDASVEGLIQADHPWMTMRPLSMVAVPTTAGTGAEVTPFATVWDRTARRKHSVAARHLYPAAAVVDPELALTLPWPETLSTGLDAYSQCFEAICNRHATPVTTRLAERGIRRVPEALRTLRGAPASIAARTAMAEAALLSGLAISRTRTGLPHAMSYPITANFGVPHGLACALNLPAVLAFNAESDDGRMDRLARNLGLGGAGDLSRSVLQLYADLGVADQIRRRLRTIGELDPYRGEMLTPGRTDNNTRDVSPASIGDILIATSAWFDGAPR